MIAISALFLFLLAPAQAKEQPLVNDEDVKSWIEFYGLDFPEGRLTYFYDPACVKRNGDTLLARWKVLGSRDQSITDYTIEIDCRVTTFSERQIIINHAEGAAVEMALSELLKDQPITKGTSADVFRKTFCR